MLTRRRFLVDGLRVTALVPALADLGRAAPGAPGERALVVVQLTGGNDGLNTVVPHRQDGYLRARPTLGLKRQALHPLDDEFGLHPALKELAPLHAEGRMSVVHGVGYPGASRSHFRSLEIWHSAEPGHPPSGTGWLGRLADQIARTAPGSLPALHVGDEELPLALVGRETRAPTAGDEHGLELAPTAVGERDRRALLELGPASGDLAFLRAAARSAYDAAERMERASARSTGVAYPDLSLARKLRWIARLVGGGLDTRVFLVTLDGFDTHARQAGAHAARLEELARSLNAFQRDLAALGAEERVLTFVHSEFGRRVEENASRGTDHGAAGPVFLLGGPVRGGLLGTPPDLAALVDGDVAFTTDFRALYTAIERDWMGLLSSSDVPAFDLAG